ncbi:hypothetical protein CBOM_05336 [Ceraceosorus bombacis]|uniref:Uncharacterized protein n=1 Tax=Ceraceosorus bombacis TaxID=401625 RepID=A0A0P1BQT0_9BASI|nr:hypothetical protein CBOM_05336 [Ceraceosorus bombacis]
MTEWPTESQQNTRWDTDPLPPSTLASSASSHASSSSTGGHVDLAEPSTGSNMIPRSGLPGPGHLPSSNNDIRLPPISSFLPPSTSSSSNSSSGTVIASRESRTHSVGALTDSRVPNRASFAPSYQQRQLDATAAPSPRLPHGPYSRRPRSSEEWSTSRTAWSGPASSSSMSVSPSYQQWSTTGPTRLPALSGVGSVPPSTWKPASAWVAAAVLITVPLAPLQVQRPGSIRRRLLRSGAGHLQATPLGQEAPTDAGGVVDRVRTHLLLMLAPPPAQVFV